MRLGIIACQALTRELCAAAVLSAHSCTMRWLPQGLHDDPNKLRQLLQQQIDLLEQENAAGSARQRLDAIVLGYGLCGGGTAALAARSLPLIVPRTDDCIALLLGSQQRYLEAFGTFESPYWLSSGWLEYANLPGESYYSDKLVVFTARYGEENARWLLAQENSWMKNYRNCVYIIPPLAGFCPATQQAAARKIANYCKLKFLSIEGSNALLEALVAGGWDERFCVCPPGGQTQRTCGAEKILFTTGEPAEPHRDSRLPPG